MTTKRSFLLAAIFAVSFCAILLAISRTVKAQGSGRIQARSQIRTTGELPCDCGVKGDVQFVQEGAQQLLNLNIKNLQQTDLYIHLSTNRFFDGTNSPVDFIAPIQRNDKKQWNWSRKLTGTNGAPPEFQILGYANLSDLSDLRCLVIGNPGTTNILGGTNFIECTQIVTNNVTVTTCFTNVQGGVTNIYIDSFAWAPIPPLLGKPSDSSFNKKAKMVRPTIPLSPQASGNLRIAYNGSKGGSLIDIQTSGLIKGQGYILWVTDAGTNAAAGDFEVPKGGNSPRYRRDTSFGDPLPLQSTSTANLTDRVFTIRDASGGIHLIGSLP